MTLSALLSPLPALIAELTVCAALFAGLALAVKGRRRALADADAAVGDARINLVLAVVDRLAVAPVIVALTTGAVVVARDAGFLGANAWLGGLWPPLALLLAVIVGDFTGYWRHRAQHSRWLWPAHAVHHSDRHLHWLSLERMHPVDRLGTAVDTIVLGALGFPAWALVGNALVRHYYGYAIHADAPWTFGRASWVLNSPAMHRWHHAREITTGCNFATVFSVWDRMFGTYHQPGPCDVPLGIDEEMGEGALGQYAHPFKAWWAALSRKDRALA
ncbi:sterol desaturase family protein [Phenylobacterium sp.]|uniref:sterol desaturase family protein n=1 Tax=Phenylobacterium sp. TaxID=1871053 RepID=UPI0025DE8AC5|nr:sterol desaturase family protein [Phenylobacterium sp.]